MPITRHDFQGCAARNGLSTVRANKAWIAIVLSPKLWVPYGREDPYPEAPVRYLDTDGEYIQRDAAMKSGEVAIDLHSLADRLAAAQGDEEIWFASRTGHIATKETRKFINDITDELLGGEGELATK